ncbi:S1C family serine protease [Deinococcus budaensis]|uniref:S1-C subfamily serine protease n=1 Tax=Deinococcus budaensis TaxID=1665626 RepID=A0A7W8GH48_9DEIO|nr:trypsin-like peptidase domain-containing protein [Deinococcus budaensis]MBB5235229.1 S1-C subfamily serine protease [Deinococcus budaensis]
MNQPLLGAALVLVGMGLGATLLRDQVPSAFAQTVPPAAPLAAPGRAGTAGTSAVQAEAQARLQNERNTVEVVRRAGPGLVFITTQQRVLLPTPFPDLFAAQVQQGLGSGFFVNAQGDILTNYHVVAGPGGEGTADRILVRVLGQEESVPARVIGVAPQYDLALIRPEGLRPALIRPIPLGDSGSGALAAGQKAIAMGAPFGLDFSVSEGIVSSARRQVPIGFSQSPIGEGITQNAVQTDAAINPGNSGGPLLDSSGRVIGVNTQIYSPSGAVTGGAQSAGVGFAIPVNTARSLLPRLQRAQGGVVTAPRVGLVPGLIVEGRGQTAAAGLSALIGEVKRDLGLPPAGLLVGRVVPDSPAARAGLRGGGRAQAIAGGWLVLGGDVIVGADGEPVDTLEDLQAALLDKEPGDRVTLRALRGGQLLDVPVTLDAASFQ